MCQQFYNVIKDYNHAVGKSKCHNPLIREVKKKEIHELCNIEAFVFYILRMFHVCKW